MNKSKLILLMVLVVLKNIGAAEEGRASVTSVDSSGRVSPAREAFRFWNGGNRNHDHGSQDDLKAKARYHAQLAGLSRKWRRKLSPEPDNKNNK